MRCLFSSVAPVYPVDDVEAAVDWYRAVLDFDPVYVNRDEDGDPTNYAVLRRDQAWLHLIRRAEAPAGRSGGVSAQFTMGGSIDELYAALQAQSVEILQPISDQPWGCRDFIIADPSGNAVWISTPQT